MRIVVFGATGMVGQGVLRECLLAPDVEEVLLVGRSPSGQHHAKVREVVRANLLDYAAIENELSNFDACFFCLGVSSNGMSDKDYERVTYDVTLAAAHALLRQNSAMIFIYVSGAGTDSSERGKTMWARVKGKTENALLALPFKGAYMFRPGFIQPLSGITSKTCSYRVIYAIAKPLMPALRLMFPKYMLTTASMGRAMLAIARHGFEKSILEVPDIQLAARS